MTGIVQYATIINDKISAEILDFFIEKQKFEGDFMHGLQTSETTELGAALAVAGGFMDAYSYICRGGVFANAQTGNMLLLGISLAEGDWHLAIKYCAPVLAFFIGISMAEMVRHRFELKSQDKSSRLHWRQTTLMFEILCLIGVCWIPQSLNLLANSVMSMACGIQVESFRKIHGYKMATTMCVGNFRSGTENLCQFIYHKDRDSLKKTFLYYGVIGCFIFGAMMGNFFIKHMQEQSILLCAAILFAAFLFMFIEEKDEKRNESA